MVQLTNGQHTCELVFKSKADILNIRCDYQFVFSVLDELMLHAMFDAKGVVLRLHFKSMKCDVLFSQSFVCTIFRRGGHFSYMSTRKHEKTRQILVERRTVSVNCRVFSSTMIHFHSTSVTV